MLGYMSIVESSFAIVAKPNKRAILSLLLSSERSPLARSSASFDCRSRPSPSTCECCERLGSWNHELKRSGACID